MKHIVTSLLAFACFAFVAPIAAADDTAAVKKIYSQNKDAVIWVTGVAKVSISARDSKTPMNFPDQEEKFEALGTIIDATGMVVTSLSNIDPAARYSGREINGPQGRMVIDATAILKDVKVVLADGTEIPFDVVLKDADLDLAFMRPKADAKEATGVAFTAVNLNNAGSADVADEVVNLARADEILNRQPQVMRSEIMTVTNKPRKFFWVASCYPGTPSFTMDGKLLGIAVIRDRKGDDNARPIPVVLPAADVMEVAEQAKTAKPIVQEEAAPAADPAVGNAAPAAAPAPAPAAPSGGSK